MIIVTLTDQMIEDMGEQGMDIFLDWVSTQGKSFSTERVEMVGQTDFVIDDGSNDIEYLLLLFGHSYTKDGSTQTEYNYLTVVSPDFRKEELIGKY